MVCDTCKDAVRDEGGEHLTNPEVESLCRSMGADIADHRCEQFDGGDGCDCACYGGPTVKVDQTEELYMEQVERLP